MPRLRVGAVGLALMAFAHAPAGHALRCGTELVQEGDYAFEIRQACGPPTAVEHTPPPDHHAQYATRDERWYYDLGDNRLLRVLHLRDGRLRRIEKREHGIGDSATRGDCKPTAIHIGMSSYRLLALCGEPDQRERRPVERERGSEAAHLGPPRVWREEWIYAFDDRYIARRVRLLAGEVVGVETLD